MVESRQVDKRRGIGRRFPHERRGITLRIKKKVDITFVGSRGVESNNGQIVAVISPTMVFVAAVAKRLQVETKTGARMEASVSGGAPKVSGSTRWCGWARLLHVFCQLDLRVFGYNKPATARSVVPARPTPELHPQGTPSGHWLPEQISVSLTPSLLSGTHGHLISISVTSVPPGYLPPLPSPRKCSPKSRHQHNRLLSPRPRTILNRIYGPAAFCGDGIYSVFTKRFSIMSATMGS
ncbi:hypothetical protein J6590_006281 [Homalodisca vitripennis]|nr:hypothetical protein J6590_006281 [Homalodisca vitripennis]